MSVEKFLGGLGHVRSMKNVRVSSCVGHRYVFQHLILWHLEKPSHRTEELVRYYLQVVGLLETKLLERVKLWKHKALGNRFPWSLEQHGDSS